MPALDDKTADEFYYRDSGKLLKCASKSAAKSARARHVAIMFFFVNPSIRSADMKIKPPASLHGFTLIEVMVVIVILGILAALVVPKVMSRPDEARIIAAKQDIGALVQALKLYKLDNVRYPTTEQGLQALVTKPAIAPIPSNWKGNGYLEKLPKDPWGNPYLYLQPGLHGTEIDVMSYGADGAAGGKDSDADIGSWEL